MVRVVGLDTGCMRAGTLEEGDLEFVLEVTGWVTKNMI